MASTLAAPILNEDEQRLVLHRIKWAQYVTIGDALPDWPSLRMIFIDGRLTFLTTSRRHDWYSKCFGYFVAAVASGCEIVWETAGRATLRREDLDSGVEGDDTFYFGENAERMRGPQDIDLTTQPPPDLAIEIEVTHPADDAMLVYGRLGVPEVWRIDVKRGIVSFWLRRDDGTYASADRSAALPLLEPGDIIKQLRLAEELGISGWLDQLNDWVRDVLLPRRGGGA
jgi:Uma2 family endonuclease